MKKLIALLLAALLTMVVCTAEENTAPAAKPLFTADELAQMSYVNVTDAYTAVYGVWWDWTQEIWLDYAAALRQAEVQSNRTGRAIAATDYILPPESALSHDQVAAIAIAAVDPAAQTKALFPCFELDGRAVYKVLLFTRPGNSTLLSGTHTVEIDAMTGEVLGVYPRTPDGTGQYVVPHDIWEATPQTAPLPSDG